MNKYLTLEEFELKESEESESSDNSNSVRDKYFKFFTKMNLEKSDDMRDLGVQIKDFCEKLKITAEDFHYECLSVLADFFQYGRYNETIKTHELEVNQKELEEGIQIEMEHTREPLMSRRIALDHLAECPDYYTMLGKMELECKKNKDKDVEKDDAE